MVDSPTRARTIMAMKPANLPKMMEKRIKPRKDTPMAMAAKVRKRPLMPMNSNGFCMPLYIGKKSSIDY